MARGGGKPSPQRITSDNALGGMVIERSLRFKRSSNTYLSRTPSSAGNRKTWTYSCWFRECATGADSTNDLGNGLFFSCGAAGTGTNMALRITNNGYIGIDYYGIGGYYSSTRHRDANGWYHCVWVMDTTLGTAADRMKVYVNGTQVHNSQMSLSQNADTPINNNSLTTIGCYPYDTDHVYRLDGYLAEVHFIDGQALDPTYFGHTEFQTGIWRAKRYEGTYGTNGFHLDFSDNTNTTTLGIDKSPNGNDFTLTSFSATAGITNDSFTMTPTSTNEFATLNPNLPEASGAQYRNGGYTFYHTAGAHMRASSNMPVNSGKWYAEFLLGSYTFASGSYPYIGVCPDDLWVNSWAGDTGTALNSAGTMYRNSSTFSGGGVSYAEGDIISVAMDLDQATPQVWWAKNGTYINSGNPATNTNGADIGPTSVTGYYNFAVSLWGATGSQWDANFGQRAFSYSIPDGFKTLCTDNIRSTQNIRPQRHFETLLYTGTGSANNIVEGLEFSPDMVWVKGRDTDGTEHMIIDSVRGGNNSLSPNSSDDESTHGGRSMTFYNRGVRWNSDSNTCNANGENYVLWCWKAGGAAVANSDGNTASQVSVNTEAGFSIVTYTGTGSSTTIGHGLGKKPEMIFMKSRSASGDWAVLDKANTTAEYTFYLNDNNPYGSSSGYTFYADTPPTSSVWTVNSASATNASGVTYVAYCWTSIPGYSKIGSYEGNSNADGTYVHLGFRPAWILLKRNDYSGNWFIVDNKRDTSNECTRDLFPNNSDNETNNPNFVDFLSNGFKLRTTGTAVNTNTIIYMAFAEQSALTAFDQANPNAR